MGKGYSIRVVPVVDWPLPLLRWPSPQYRGDCIETPVHKTYEELAEFFDSLPEITA